MENIMEKSHKFLIETSVLLTSISLKAKKAGNGLKEYLYEDDTIKHVSLVLYDLLPLTVKIGMRYEKFHDMFSKNFKGIRNALLGAEKVVEMQEPVKKVVRKTVKKVVTKTNKLSDTKATPTKTTRKPKLVTKNEK